MKGYIVYLDSDCGLFELGGYQKREDAEKFVKECEHPKLSIREGYLYKVVEICDGERTDYAQPTSWASCTAILGDATEMAEQFNLVTEYEIVPA